MADSRKPTLDKDLDKLQTVETAASMMARGLVPIGVSLAFIVVVMLAAGGYPWTVIPVERRAEYMQALEQASVQQNIAPFSTFVGGLVADNMAGHPAAALPKA